MFATIDSDQEVARFRYHEPWSAPVGPSFGKSPSEAFDCGSYVTDEGDDRKDRSVVVEKGKCDERDESAMVADSTFFGERRRPDGRGICRHVGADRGRMLNHDPIVGNERECDVSRGFDGHSNGE